jgi:hypothetical protein
MLKILYKTTLLALVFLLSPLDAAYAGIQCLLVTQDTSCTQPRKVAVSHCCSGKTAYPGPRLTSHRSCSSKPCSLEYSLAKSFDPMINNARGGTGHILLLSIHTVSALPTLSGSPAAPIQSTNITPPDLIILLRNLRI